MPIRATTEDSSPTASINSLPLEIKTLIVKLAKLQDESYKARNKSLHEEIYELTEGVLKENRWRGKSLNALFEVNKEWSELAAIHIFETFTRGQTLSPDFKYIVLVKRIQNFRTIELYGTKLAEEKFDLALILPNLDKIQFNNSASERLFGNFAHRTVEQEGRYGALKNIGHRITKFYMWGTDSSALFSTLEALPNLTEIILPTKGANWPEAETDKLGVLLAQYSSLKKLSLAFYEGSIPASWTDFEWKSASSLRSLTLIAPRILNTFQTDLDFISKFSSSLECLVLNVHIPSSFSPLIPSITFPKLTLLDITCEDEDLPHFLEVFSGSPIVSIRYKTYRNTSQVDRVTLDKVLAKFISDHPSFRKLEYVDRFLHPQALPEVEKLSTSRQLILKYSTWINQDVDESNPAWILSDQQQFDYRRPLLNEALDYGKVRLVELERENNVEGLKEMFDNCKWLRANAAEMKD